MKKIIITGVTGQDGSHMADFLLKKPENYIIGGVRRLSVPNHKNIDHLKDHPRFNLIDLDITDHENTNHVISEEKPDFFINFAANSFVGKSWKMPINHMQTNCLAVCYQLDAIKNFSPNCRYYNAGTSEEFGDVISLPQSESHPLRPQSPYGASKCAARHMIRVYRESYNLFALQGWLFNHEGTRRGLEFVTRKITNGIAKIKIALEKGDEIPVLKMGNLDSSRDWSDAEDFMEGIWLMLTQDKPKEFVLSSGENHTIRNFIKVCLNIADIDYKQKGDGLKEKFLTKKGKTLIEINPKYYRPAEVNKLCGDSTLAEKELNWKRKTNFEDLVKKMYNNDYNLLKNE